MAMSFPAPENESERVTALRALEIMDPPPDPTYDEIVSRLGLEKLKTVGDAYMAVAGLPAANRVDACLAALEMLAALAKMKSMREKLRLSALEMRVGLHSGPVMSGGWARISSLSTYGATR
jgi:class 3 adenylate cyclase